MYPFTTLGSLCAASRAPSSGAQRFARRDRRPLPGRAWPRANADRTPDLVRDARSAQRNGRRERCQHLLAGGGVAGEDVEQAQVAVHCPRGGELTRLPARERLRTEPKEVGELGLGKVEPTPESNDVFRTEEVEGARSGLVHAIDCRPVQGPLAALRTLENGQVMHDDGPLLARVRINGAGLIVDDLALELGAAFVAEVGAAPIRRA